jgi:septum formation protein
MLVLASASPRRRELLRNAGIQFTVQPADINETPLEQESAKDCAERLAREKALTIFRTRPEDEVLGADTVVAIGKTILGKPIDAEDAARMLRLLSGRVHQVVTGICIVRRADRAKKDREDRDPGSEHADIRTGSETTLVTMGAISEKEIQGYIATGEPMDKAGAYAIQGIAARWIPRIEGDYSNVVGLPVALVCSMLRAK